MAKENESALAKLSTPAKAGIGAALVVLIALGYWVVFYSDVSAKITQAQNTNTAKKKELADQQVVQTTYLNDKDELARRQQQQGELNRVLPAEAEAPSFLSALQQIANVSGVDLKAWQPMEEQQQTFYAKVPMRLEMTGRFHQIAKFTYEAARVQRIMNVENLELTEPKLEGDEVQLKAKCVAIAFHAVKPKPVGAPGAPPGGAAPAPPPPPPGGGH
jgi:type IV pilus assembly protein PilO